MKRLSRRELERRAEGKTMKRGIRKGDKVKVLCGKDAGTEGRVLQVYRDRGKVLVERVNLVKRHQRPTQQLQKGGIIEKESPVNISNVQLICSKCNKPTRTRRERLPEGHSVRVCVNCKEMIDKV